MQGSAVCSFSLRVVYGYRVAYIVGHHDTQCLSLGSLVFAHLGGIRDQNATNVYLAISYNYIFLLLQYHI